MQYKSYNLEENFENLKNVNIALFYGENLGLINEFKSLIKEKNKENSIIRFTQDELLKNNELLFNEIKNDSLFQEEKVFLIDQTDDKIYNLIEEISKIIKGQKIFLFSENLEKRSKLRNFFEKGKDLAIVACYQDNEIGIRKLIQKKLKNFKGMTPDNINIILNNSNLERSKLQNELDKIVMYFQDKNLDTEKLEELLNIKINDDFNKLKDKALIGDKNKTNELLSDTVIDNDKNVYYINLINQRLKKLLEIREIDKNNIEQAINELKPPIFWKDKQIFILQAKKWNKQKIVTLLKKTYNLEINLKSSYPTNNSVLIKKLIVDICSIANA